MTEQLSKRRWTGNKGVHRPSDRAIGESNESVDYKDLVLLAVALIHQKMRMTMEEMQNDLGYGFNTGNLRRKLQECKDEAGITIKIETLPHGVRRNVYESLRGE